MVKKFNSSLFIACLIGGVIGWVINEIIYNAFMNSLNPIVQTGVYFAILMFAIALPGIFSEWSTNHLSGYAWDGGIVRRTFKFLIIFTILAFLIGALFQFLYGLGRNENTKLEADDYLIIIDNSGSTSTTDPYGERFSAVVQFINSLDKSKKVMISIFSDKNKIVLPLTTVSDELVTEVEEIFRSYKSDAGTNIQDALLNTLQEYPVSKRKAIAVLFSDGESEIDLVTLKDTFENAGVTIFTIGFSMKANSGKTLLENVAFETGGLYYEINEMTDFSTALTEIKNYNVRRDLLSYRNEIEKSNILYIFLRVFFIFIIGMLMGPAFGLIFDSEEILTMILIRIGTSLSAGIVLEAGLYLGGKDNIIRLFMSILLSLLFTHYHITEYTDNFSSSYNGLQSHSEYKNSNQFSEVKKKNVYKDPSNIYTFSNKKESDIKESEPKKNKPKFK